MIWQEQETGLVRKAESPMAMNHMRVLREKAKMFMLGGIKTVVPVNRLYDLPQGGDSVRYS